LENRKDRRFPEKNAVLLNASSLDPQSLNLGEINAFTHDISLSGARILCKQDFPVGRIVRIVIDLKRSHQSVRVDGKVIWSRKSKRGKNFEIGVEFLHTMSETILSLIRHLYGKEVGIPSSVS
jgi:hypothetical protein